MASKQCSGTEIVLKMLVYLLFNHLTHLLVWKSFTEFSLHESFRLYKSSCLFGRLGHIRYSKLIFPYRIPSIILLLFAFL